LQTYLDDVAAYRGRSISLLPIDTALLAGTGCGTGSGLWIAKQDSDVIAYGADTTEWHAEHIIMHELGHMLLGHGPEQSESGEAPTSAPTVAAVADLLPSISPESIAHVLGRTDYGTRRERDAETFADMVMLHAMRPPSRDSLLHRTFFRDRRR
jgi:predicted Zn-dependent protease